MFEERCDMRANSEVHVLTNMWEVRWEIES